MSRRHKESENADTGQVMTLDAFSNALFRLGLGSQAPIEATEYPLTRMTDNYALLNSLYRGNWVVQNVVEIIPDDMLREWFNLTGDIAPDSMDEISRVFRNTQLRDKLNRGLCWGRLYGGAAGLILVKGQDDLSEPLDLSTVLPGSFQGLYILDRWSGITPGMEIVNDPGDRDFNLPMWYDITNARGETVAHVHHSRIIRFTGRELPFLEQVAEMYWGESEIEAIFEDIKKHDNVSANMANLTFRANTDIMSVENLEQLISVGGKEQLRRFWETMQAISVVKSNFGLQLMNRDDKFQNNQYTFTGLKDVYDSMCLDLSGATRIPVTKLFGRSPAGMNATGESDLKNYYDYVDTKRESDLRPILEQLMPVIFMSAIGYVPDTYDIQFPPLWTPTADELANIANKKADTIIGAYQSGLLDKKTAMYELKQLSDETGMFGSISDDDINAAAGVTWKDDTALKDPLSGIGGAVSSPFDIPVADSLTMDYPGQPLEHGKFSFGKMLTSGQETGKLQSSPQKVVLPDGTVSRISEGTEITKIKTFAGKGTKTPYRDAGRLSKQYGGDASEWEKVRGDGYVDFEGRPRHCELHWSECKGQDRLEMKVKRWFE